MKNYNNFKKDNLNNNIGSPNMKFIKDLKSVKLLENVKQTKTYIEKQAEKDDNFDKEFAYDILEELKKLFKKSPNYIYNFFKYINEQDLKLKKRSGEESQFDSVEGFVEWMKQNSATLKLLPKNLIQYKSYEKLVDDITKTIEEVNTKYFWDMVKYLNYDKTNADYINENKEKIDSLAKSFGNLPYKIIREYSKKTMKYYKENGVTIEEFLSGLELFIKRGNSREDIDKIIKEYPKSVNTIYDKDDVLMVQTENKEAIKKLGSQSWCIVYSDSYFTQYCDTKTFNTQYIIFNFNLPPNNPNSKFGLTIDINGKPLYGGHQNKNNIGVDLEEISRKTKIPMEEFGTRKKEKKENYLSIINKLENVDSINDFFKIYDIIEDDDIKSMLSNDLSYNNLVHKRLLKSEDMLVTAFDVIQSIYNKKVDINLFSELTEELISKRADMKYDNFISKHDNFIEDFYNEIFSKHKWVFKPFLDMNNFNTETVYEKALAPRFHEVGLFITAFIHNFIKQVLIPISNIDNEKDRIESFISFLSNLLELDKDYFDFIVTRLGLTNFSINKYIKANEIELEYFNTLREKYKDLFKLIEGKEILESIGENKIKYKDLQLALLSFLSIEDSFKMKKNGYNDANVLDLVNSYKGLYRLYKSTGDEYFETLNYEIKVKIKNLGGIRNVFKDDDSLMFIEDINKTPYLKWYKEYFFNVNDPTSIIPFYEMYIRVIRFEKSFEHLERLISYDKNIINEFKEEIKNASIDIMDNYNNISKISSLFEEGKFDNLYEEIILDFVREKVINSYYNLLEFEEIKRVLNILKENAEEEMDLVLNELIEFIIYNYYDEEGFIDLVLKLNNSSVEFSWDEYIEEGYDNGNEYFEAVYKLYTEVETDIPNNGYLASMGYLKNSVSNEELSNVINEEYDSKLGYFLFKLDNFEDLNDYYELDPFGVDSFDIFYDSDHYLWNDTYSGYTDIDVDGVLTIGNILLNENPPSLQQYEDFIKSYISKERYIKNEDITWPERWTKLKELQDKIIEENSDSFNEVKNVIEEILEESEYDICEEIKVAISRSVAEAQALADESEYFNKNIDNLPSFFENVNIEGKDTKYRFKDDNLELFIDIEELLEYTFNDISYYTSEQEDLTLENMIGHYFNTEGVIDPPRDVYGTIDEGDFNERLSDLLYEITPTNESVIFKIKKFSDF